MTSPAGITRREMMQRTIALGAVAPQLAGIASAARSGWQIACYTRPWAKYEYTVALDAIAEAGFKYVGLMTTNSPSRLIISAQSTEEEAHKVGEECRKRHLGISSLWGGGIPVAESLEAGIAGLRRLIDNCVAAKAGNLLMGGVGNPKLHEPYYKAISECCAYARKKGIGMSIKPHGGTNATGPQCRTLIQSVGCKKFGLWYDPGNIFFYSGGKIDPVDDAASVDGLVVGMSVKDFRAPKQVDLTPGTGMVNFPKVLARLEKGGFRKGPLVVECLNPGEPAQLLEEAKKARAFVEGLVSGL